MATVQYLTEQINNLQTEIDDNQAKVDALQPKIAQQSALMQRYKSWLGHDCSNRKDDPLLLNKKSDCYAQKAGWRDKYMAAQKAYNDLVGSQRTPLLKEIQRLKNTQENLKTQRAEQQEQEKKTSRDVSMKLAERGETKESVLENEKQEGETARHGQELTKDSQNALLMAQAKAIESGSSNKKKIVWIVLAVGIVAVGIGGFFIFKKIKK